MDLVLLGNVIGTLFPRQDSDALSFSSSDGTTTTTTTTTQWNEELRVTEEELFEAAKRIAPRYVAPGPDGIPGRVWAESIDTLALRLRHLPEGGRLPPDMAYGEISPTAEERSSVGLSVPVQAGVPSRRGGQGVRESDRRPSGGPYVGACAWMAR
ncbi:uncharacterized protein LOC122577562 [Bombus pyrosoma]|uniref:uncharacterized protein LOC122577562 n=1 Tax=Bombus pyrosoma TaxID=396416 RepID=UPI001CB9C925|nr:uncharacterized protein LOC122577562 [Bombus pyrosoma]